MHRIDNSKFLLFIEPKKEDFSSVPENDPIVMAMTNMLRTAKKGVSNYSNLNEPARFTEGASYKGVHYTPCGKTSDSCDYLLENGMITNSMAAYYLQHYRKAIPESELLKVRDLFAYYVKNMRK